MRPIRPFRHHRARPAGRWHTYNLVTEQKTATRYTLFAYSTEQAEADALALFAREQPGSKPPTPYLVGLKDDTRKPRWRRRWRPLRTTRWYP